MINLFHKKEHWRAFITSFVFVFGIAFVGSNFTASGIDSGWYDSIKPSITPPSFVFPIVWNILFFLIALSFYFSLIGAKKKDMKFVWAIFGINLFLNVLWSFLFFVMQNPVNAFLDLLLLWVSILGMIHASYKIDKRAGWMLVPYLLWVAFAGVLNWLIAF